MPSRVDGMTLPSGEKLGGLFSRPSMRMVSHAQVR